MKIYLLLYIFTIGQFIVYVDAYTINGRLELLDTALSNSCDDIWPANYTEDPIDESLIYNIVSNPLQITEKCNERFIAYWTYYYGHYKKCDGMHLDECEIMFLCNIKNDVCVSNELFFDMIADYASGEGQITQNTFTIFVTQQMTTFAWFFFVISIILSIVLFIDFKKKNIFTHPKIHINPIRTESENISNYGFQNIELQSLSE